MASISSIKGPEGSYSNPPTPSFMFEKLLTALGKNADPQQILPRITNTGNKLDSYSGNNTKCNKYSVYLIALRFINKYGIKAFDGSGNLDTNKFREFNQNDSVDYTISPGEIILNLTNNTIIFSEYSGQEIDLSDVYMSVSESDETKTDQSTHLKLRFVQDSSNSDESWTLVGSRDDGGIVDGTLTRRFNQRTLQTQRFPKETVYSFSAGEITQVKASYADSTIPNGEVTAKTEGLCEFDQSSGAILKGTVRIINTTGTINRTLILDPIRELNLLNLKIVRTNPPFGSFETNISRSGLNLEQLTWFKCRNVTNIYEPKENAQADNQKIIQVGSYQLKSKMSLIEFELKSEGKRQTDTIYLKPEDFDTFLQNPQTLLDNLAPYKVQETIYNHSEKTKLINFIGQIAVVRN